MELEDYLEKISEIIQQEVGQIYSEATKMYSGGCWEIDGYDVDDVVQQAIVNFLEYISKKPVEYIKDRTNKAFVLSSIKTQITQVVAGLFRKRNIRFKNQSSVKTSLYKTQGEGRFAGFEDVEIDNARSKLSPSFKAMLRLIEEGATIEQIKFAFGVTSTRKYYKIYNNFQAALKVAGYTDPRE